MRVLEGIAHQFWKFGFLVRAKAPARVIASHYSIAYRDKLSPDRSVFKRRRDEFQQFIRARKFDNDWFTHNIPTWFSAFKKCGIQETDCLDCLEIGSWQGMSALFTLMTFPNAKLVCVDTWEGADEHKSLSTTTADVLSAVEASFDENLAEFSRRFTKYKGTSLSYFADHFENDRFDVIYVDGSHHSDDVSVDVVKSFEMLKPGGIMILDDYFFTYYKRVIDNPAGAINGFLRTKAHQLEIICFDYQMIIRKSKSSVRWEH